MEKNEVRLRKNSLPHVRRLKSVKRQSEKGEKVERKQEIVLESVLGLTVSGPSSLATSSVPGGLLAYPAGCVVVLYSLASRSQRHLINDDRLAQRRIFKNVDPRKFFPSLLPQAKNKL